MAKKALLNFAAVLAVLFPLAIFAQEQGQESATKSGEKSITYNDLQAQKKTLDELRASYAKIQADYNAECKEKTYATMNEYPKEECDKKFAQIAKSYNDLKKEVDAYNKNVAQFQTGSGQKATDASLKK
jgi:hypothetical protein